MKDFSDNGGLILASNAMLSLEDAIRLDRDLSAKIFQFGSHAALVLLLALQGCAAFPLIVTGVAVVDDLCDHCLPRPR